MKWEKIIDNDERKVYKTGEFNGYFLQVQYNNKDIVKYDELIICHKEEDEHVWIETFVAGSEEKALEIAFDIFKDYLELEKERYEDELNRINKAQEDFKTIIEK